MATFSVILEDRIVVADVTRYGNRRVVTIEANNLQNAWDKARTEYYTRKTAGPNTQIVDIKTGVYKLPEPPLSPEEPPHGDNV